MLCRSLLPPPTDTLPSSPIYPANSLMFSLCRHCAVLFFLPRFPFLAISASKPMSSSYSSLSLSLPGVSSFCFFSHSLSAAAASAASSSSHIKPPPPAPPAPSSISSNADEAAALTEESFVLFSSFELAIITGFLLRASSSSSSSPGITACCITSTVCTNCLMCVSNHSGSSLLPRRHLCARATRLHVLRAVLPSHFPLLRVESNSQQLDRCEARAPTRPTGARATRCCSTFRTARARSAAARRRLGLRRRSRRLGPSPFRFRVLRPFPQQRWTNCSKMSSRTRSRQRKQNPSLSYLRRVPPTHARLRY